MQVYMHKYMYTYIQVDCMAIDALTHLFVDRPIIDHDIQAHTHIHMCKYIHIYICTYVLAHTHMHT